MTSVVSPTPAPATQDERLGFVLVFLSALCWSFGGTVARFIDTGDSWTVIFWRSFWAASFLFGFMVWRDGRLTDPMSLL